MGESEERMALDGGALDVVDADPSAVSPRRSEEGCVAGGARVRAKDRRVVRTKAAIRDALKRLLAEHDFSSITISAIAREANIDRKTFYLHYPSVDAVLDEYFRDRAYEMMRRMRADVEAHGGVLSVEILYKELSAGIAEDFEQSKLALAHVPYDLVLDKVESALTEALIADAHLGLAQMGPYLGYCVSFFAAGLVAVYRRWVLADSEIPLEALAEVTSAAMLEGVNGVVRASRAGEAS